MKTKRHVVLLPIFIIGFVYAVILISCGGTTSSSGFTGSSATFSGLGEAAISSPFTAATSSSSLVLNAEKKILPATYAERKATIEALLAATDKESCQFAIDGGMNNAYADCYGSTIAFVSGDHPDGTYTPEPGYTLPSGDVGIWNEETAGGEACVAAQVNQLVNNYTKFAYMTHLAGAALVCFVNTSGISVPTTVGNSTDLTTDQLSDFAFAGSGGSFTPSAASITAIEDSSGNKGYKMSIEGAIVLGASSRPFKMIVKYADKASGGYAGMASYLVRDSDQNEQHCGAVTGRTQAGSMTFARASSTADVQVSFNTANYCGTTYDPLVGTDDTLEACDKIDSTNDINNDPSNGWAGNWNQLVFNYDPSTMIGKYSYAWQAGPNDGWTRTFNAAISSASEGVGYFGFGPDVAAVAGGTCTKAATVGSITKMICNWAGPSTNPGTPNRQPVDLVQKQTMTKTAGVWTSASQNIHYAPTNNCNMADDLVYCVGNASTTTCAGATKTNDHATAGNFDNNLEDIATYTTDFGAQPTTPTF